MGSDKRATVLAPNYFSKFDGGEECKTPVPLYDTASWLAVMLLQRSLVKEKTSWQTG